VRRGAEREIHDLGTRLVAAGTDVRLLTSTPEGLSQRTTFDGLPVRYLRLPRPPALARRGLSDVAAFAALALPYVSASRADLVHAWHYGDGWAAVQAKRVRRGRPVVLKLTGTVLPEQMEHIRVDRRLFREAITGADEVWCNSGYARDAMTGFGVSMEVVPAGVDLDRFVPASARHTRPTVLCASAPDDPRKRLVDVLDAWPAVLDALPDARLVLAGRATAATRAQLLGALEPAVAGSVELVGDLRDDALVEAYGRAAAVVAPALHEALGLSTIEALACGTPVAGARSGATPALLSPATGRTYEPGSVDGCAEAIVEAVALSSQPGTAEACRATAVPFGWDVIVPRVQARWLALR
jgi:glycosyltransferase involved in cell wall biosynthesis